MSQWLVNDFSTGMHIGIEGPNGHYFYSDETDQPILMVVAGTGLAPLFGIVRDALHQGHQSAIHLYHGAVSPEELYLHDTLLEITQKYANFHYHGCVNNVENMEGIISGHAPEMVKKTSKMTFLSGANMKDKLKNCNAYLSF